MQDSYIETLRDGEYKEYLESIVREVLAGTEGEKAVMKVWAGGEDFGELADPRAPSRSTRGRRAAETCGSTSRPTAPSPRRSTTG